MIKIIKSFRKTISLSINKELEVIVKAPFHITKKTIETFLAKHRDWIDKQKLNISNQNQISFLEWEKVPFLWDNFKIIFDDKKTKKITFDWDYFIVNTKYREKTKDILIDFYKNKALLYIKERVDFFAIKYNLVYNNIRISSAKWKWWSCSSKKNLTFVYNLVLANKKIIDYVIVHELAHLKQMNHSKLFWLEVENMMIDYKEHRLWLKQYWNSLRF